MDGDQTATTRADLNWGLIGMVGLSVEFWIVLGLLIAQYGL
jgi:hypothetical protein